MTKFRDFMSHRLSKKSRTRSVAESHFAGNATLACAMIFTAMACACGQGLNKPLVVASKRSPDAKTRDAETIVKDKSLSTSKTDVSAQTGPTVVRSNTGADAKDESTESSASVVGGNVNPQVGADTTGAASPTGSLPQMPRNSPDTPAQDADTSQTSIFVASGQAGRRLASCDGGRTWTGDTSFDDSLRCENGFDCDHHRGAGRGLALGDGYAFAAFGWGTPGTVMRTANGIDWDTVRTSDSTLSDLAFLEGTLLGGGSRRRASTDKGTTWTDEPAQIPLGFTRDVYALSDWKRFLMGGENGSAGAVAFSSDVGRTWTAAQGFGACKHGQLAQGNKILVMVGWDGTPCVSTDGGRAWQSTGLSNESRPIIHNGNQFLAYSRDGWLHKSTDGKAWMSERLNPAVGFDRVAYDPLKKSYVAVRSQYARQEFYYSENGVNWTLSTGHKASHPITHVESGRVLKSTACKPRVQP